MAFAGNGQGRFFPTSLGRRLPGKCTWLRYTQVRAVQRVLDVTQSPSREAAI